MSHSYLLSNVQLGRSMAMQLATKLFFGLVGAKGVASPV
ncbi:unnamed protein product [Acidithrix sp. C25]|nr:unnamed protein product [Acidithrix sp. C25]